MKTGLAARYACFVILAVLYGHLWPVGLTSRALGGEAPLLRNGNFAKWTDGKPDGWTVAIGARNGGQQPVSQLSAIKGPALLLRGDQATLAWRVLTQEIAVRPGDPCVLEFESRTKDVRQEGRQHNNCYIGLASFTASEQAAGRKTKDVSNDNDRWSRHRIEFQVPPDAVSTQVVIFLSKTGMLGVRNLKVTLDPNTADPTRDQSTTEPASRVVNGNFREWSGDDPVGWTRETGAQNGGMEPASLIERVGSGGVTLRGDQSTLLWYSLNQELKLEQGKTYTLSFEARAADVRREGRQFDNCYVGIISLDSQGERLDLSVKDLSRTTRWQKQRLHFRVPPNADRTKLLIFLSKTGTLTVRTVDVKEASAEQPFRGARQ